MIWLTTVACGLFSLPLSSHPFNTTYVSSKSLCQNPMCPNHFLVQMELNLPLFKSNLKITMWIVKTLYNLPRRPIFTCVFHGNPSFLCSATSTALKPHLVFFLTTMFLLTRKYFFLILVYQSFFQHSRPNPISLCA